jgi:hypothetical protein
VTFYKGGHPLEPEKRRPILGTHTFEEEAGVVRRGWRMEDRGWKIEDGG